MLKIRKNGFTLIELLVVIAILALLMAILMPALSRVREQGKTIMCRSNLNQYGIGMRMYLDDNDYYFPETSNWMKSTSSGWVKKGEIPDGQLWPYIKNMDCHMCPRFAQLVKDDRVYGDTASELCTEFLCGQRG